MTSALHVQWIVDGVVGREAEGWKSSLASNRYRVLAPYEALRERNVVVSLLPLERWSAAEQSVGKADVIAIGKIAPGGDIARVKALCDRTLEQLAVARAQGLRAVADFNDDHFDRPVVGSYWRRLSSSVDVCVAGSPAMADRLRTFTAVPVRVIGDPALARRCSPRVFRADGVLTQVVKAIRRQPQATLRMLWFGNLNNWPALLPWAESLAPLARSQPWQLDVLTLSHPPMLEAIERFNRQHGPAAAMRFVPWSEEAQADLLGNSHVVLLPSDPNDPAKSVKTANRLADAVWSGNFVLASALPAYQPFAAAVVLGEQPWLALRDYLKDPEAAMLRIQDGQDLVQRKASKAACGTEWAQAFAAARAMPNNPEPVRMAAPVTSSVVRLNLGCGDKILPGYVNVDVVEARAGHSPDVICDLRDLHVLDTASADEVMAIHVVEHFWRWEVADVLREWVRVLKPGGKIILECPNLLSACRELLANPEERARSDAQGQRSMWVFYGDPAWKDPLMVHRWGYTPQSLSELMKEVGLVDVRQEPAEYKLREPRDMRLIGFKPSE